MGRVAKNRDESESVMRVLNVHLQQLEYVADSVDVSIENHQRKNSKNTSHTFVIRPTASKQWRTINPITGRRVHAVCWHGHLAFYRKLFSVVPDAKIQTVIESYNSLEDLERKKGIAYDYPKGSVVEPFTLGEACECED